MTRTAHSEIHEIFGSLGRVDPWLRRALFMLADRIDAIDGDGGVAIRSCAEPLQVAGGYIHCTKAADHPDDHYASLGPNSLTVSWPQGTSILGTPSP